MTVNQIQQIIDKKAIPDSCKELILIETHISWVLMADHFVYKIKKPLKLSFLDFSTLGKRAYYCQQELELNRRLAPDIYLDVLPIVEAKGQVKIVNAASTPIDFCVRMKKMNPARHMKLLLENGQVTLEDMSELATVIARFHKSAEVLTDTVKATQLQADFADILNYEQLISEYLGKVVVDRVRESVALSEQFIQTHADRIQWRDQNGFTRDCHGDLHAGNIFILDRPVVFDCIEFNDHFRQIDVLNELAFFSMDLEYFGHPELSSVFMDTYLELHPCLFNQDDFRIWHYYKFYRANVKLKVNMIKCSEAANKKVFNQRLKLAKAYYDLLDRYHREITSPKLQA